MTVYVSRILVAIEERKQRALAAVGEFGGSHWAYGLISPGVLYEGDGSAWSALEILPRHGDRVGPHIEENDPRSTLRSCEADFRVLERHAECGLDGHCDDGGHGNDAPPYGCADLDDLAARYGVKGE